MTRVHTIRDVFAEVIAGDRSKSFRDCWVDFAYWEESRNYGDDPGRASKDAIDWVEQMESCRLALESFKGTSFEDCSQAIEAAFEAFTSLDHAEELVGAVNLWHEWRTGEEQSENRADASVSP